MVPLEVGGWKEPFESWEPGSVSMGLPAEGCLRCTPPQSCSRGGAQAPQGSLPACSTWRCLCCGLLLCWVGPRAWHLQSSTPGNPCPSPSFDGLGACVLLQDRGLCSPGAEQELGQSFRCLALSSGAVFRGRRAAGSSCPGRQVRRSARGFLPSSWEVFLGSSWRAVKEQRNVLFPQRVGGTAPQPSSHGQQAPGPCGERVCQVF